MTTWRNYDEVVSTLISHEFEITHLEIGRMQRVKRPGHDQKGWYILHEITLEDNSSALIGSFGYWHGGEKFKEKISAGKNVTLSKEQQVAIRARHAEAVKKAEQQRLVAHENASKKATFAWGKYVPDGASPYLKRKNVNGYGLRYSPAGNGTLAIPIQDANGRIWGLQIIRGNERGNKIEKQYWPLGLNKKGNFFLVGGSPKSILLVTEGYATAASLHEATGLPVAVAFDAGNLMPASMALHKKYPRTKILICADDDYLTAGNPGCKLAESAALAVNGAWVKPEFPDREGKKLTDFNDLANFPSCSLSTIMVQIEAKIQSLGWGNATAQAVASTKGDGGVAYLNAGYLPALSIMDLDALVERFIPIDDGIGECVFDTRTHKIASKKQMITLLEAGVRIDDIKRHYLWQSRGAYYFDEIGFDPTEKDSEVKLNLWTGWPMKPKQGECKLLLQTLEYLCSKESNSDDLLWWIIKWMAYPLQNPGAKMASALILHGPQGTGKSLIFRTLAKIYGRYSTVIGNSGIEDKFNADWSDSKLLILAEEIATSADKWNIKNELKELVTGDTVRVRAMHMNAYHQKNQMNLVFLSNEDLPIPIEQDDRRHCVVYTPPALEKSHYTAALEEIDNGGVEALYYFLMNVDLTGFTRHTPPPSSTAKQNLISLSLPSDRRFIKEWLEGLLNIPICPCKSMTLYRSYLDWCKENGETRPRPSNQFLGMVNNLTGWKSGLKRIYANLHYHGAAQPARIIIPSDDILNKNGSAKSPDKTESEWLTDWIIHFEDKKQGENDEN